MFVYFIKFLHILAALSLLGVVFLCITAKKPPLTQKILFILAIVALVTGTALVYPKSFTFHTPWIMAAYLLLGIFGIFVLFLNKISNIKFAKGVYIFLFFILILIIHDAISKSTVLF